MRVTRVTANLRVADLEAAKAFYTGYLGLSDEEFDLGWVARCTSPATGAHVQLVTRDATSPEDSVVSVHTDEVDAAYDEARRRGYEIVHPLTTEPWGVRRFLVRAPDGNVVNVVAHGRREVLPPAPDSDTPWEPPIAGTELEHVLGALERLRATFRWKADGLDAEGLRTTVGASALSLAGLLKHLALVEDYTFATKLRGDPPGSTWDPSVWDDDPDWEFTSAAGDEPEALYALWDGAVRRSRARLAAVLTAGGLEQPVALSDDEGNHASLRRLLCDLLEEYGRHTGHADLLREAVDGRVGEDPPAGWRPGSG